MGTRAVATGPIGERVRRRLTELREDRRLTLSQLSERLARLGRPILPTGLSKIENGERRVDVDDLVALAVALDVPPNALLMPADRDPEMPTALTAETSVTMQEAWMWAVGERPLTPDLGSDQPEDPAALPAFYEDWADRVKRFLREGRPYAYRESADHERLVNELNDASREIVRLRAELKDQGRR